MPTTHNAWQRNGKWLLLEKRTVRLNAPQRPMEFDTFFDLLEYTRRNKITATVPFHN